MRQGLLAQIVEELLLLDPFSRSGLTLLTITLGRYLWAAGRARVIASSTVPVAKFSPYVITDGATQGL
jgi:hypothetical protein